MNSIESNNKMDGFNGEKAIILPADVIGICASSPLIRNLFITDMGFYPKARNHIRKRMKGASQHILIYCTDGTGWFESDGHTINLKQGQFLFIPAGVPHVYGSAQTDPWSIYWIHFQGEQVDSLVSLFNTTKACSVYRSVYYSEERIRLFERIYTTLESGYSTDNLTYANMCLWHFLSSFCYPDIFLLPQQKEYKDAMDIAIEYMLKNLHRPLQIQELASNAHISVSYFSTLFKKKTGYPPLEYFNHIKIQKACQYLQFSKLHVKEIAYKVGIDDQFYFSRLFTNMMGISPAEYRQKKRFHQAENSTVV